MLLPSQIQIPCFNSPRVSRVATALVLAGAALTGCAERAGTPTDPGTDPPTSEATASVTAGPALTQISAGGDFTCGVAATGQAYCWGRNLWGQLGNGTTQSSTRPVQVAGGLSVRQISAGDRHTCAVTTGNLLYCWGSGRYVGVGIPPNDDEREPNVTEPRPVAPTLRFQSVSANVTHTCAITVGDRRAYCWGYNTEGGLGDGTTTFRTTPVRVAGSHAWRQVSAGNFFTCGITMANIAWCWGRDGEGQLGDGPTEQRKLRPVRVAGDRRFIQIGSGEFNTCAVTETRRAWCWGQGVSGAIGDGNTLDRYTPRAVVGGHTFDRVSAGFGHICAESTTNRAYCWGLNNFGQLGNGTISARVTRPALVVGGFHFVQVDAGSTHTCGRTSDNVVRCWGSNGSGELGDGTTTNRSRPTPIVGG